jgi:type VI secretion system protein ImpE
MTPYEAFAEGRLEEAVELQEELVRANPQEVSPRVALVELLLFTPDLDDIRTHLSIIDSDDPAWPQTRRTFKALVKAESMRRRNRLFDIVPKPIPKHARALWRANKRLREDDPAGALKWIDRADAAAPVLRGFLDGREFNDIRDSDDRFTSVLEMYADGVPIWCPWNAIRRVKLAPAKFVMDRFARFAELRLRDGSDHEVYLPLLYPGSHEADGAFATGLQTDHICPDDGPIRCIGGKELMVDGEDVALGDVTMIEIR